MRNPQVQEARDFAAASSIFDVVRAIHLLNEVSLRRGWLQRLHFPGLHNIVQPYPHEFFFVVCNRTRKTKTKLKSWVCVEIILPYLHIITFTLSFLSFSIPFTNLHSRSHHPIRWYSRRRIQPFALLPPPFLIILVV